MLTGREGPLYSSAARTATPADHELVWISPEYKTLAVIINVTAISATPSVVPKIQGKSASGVWYDILTGAAITGTGTVVLRVAPGMAAAANVAADFPLPAVFRLVMTHGDTDSITYTADYCLS